MKLFKRRISARRTPLLVFAAALVAAAPASATAADSSAQHPLAQAVWENVRGDEELLIFYQQHRFRPLWIEAGQSAPQASALLELLGSAEADGLESSDYLHPAVSSAISNSEAGASDDLARLEIALSRAFVAYMRDVREVRDADIVYGEPLLRPSPASAWEILSAAAEAPSMVDYVREMAWMNPIYTGLRQSIAEAIAKEGTTPDLGLLQLNLERARALPAREDPYILVDAAAAQLTVFDGGEAQETMRVVVGAPEDATPMMVGMLRYATLNPYWHVPPDLTRERIAPRVIDEGMSYFRGRGYEVVDDWVSGQVIDPRTIDWQAVADGSIELFIRQKPGPRNAMGRIKFQFPNNLGIYLHDTPAKHLFELDNRSASAGCVRLEDADALAAILFGEQPMPQSSEPEQTLHLPEPVPVYITYLTAVPENGRIVRREDIYGWDDEKLASVAPVPEQGEGAL